MSQEPQKRSWWEKPKTAWIVSGVIAVGVSIGLICFQDWGMMPTNEGSANQNEGSANQNDQRPISIRNLIFALAGVGAFLGVWLASIRGIDFAEQVKTQTRQTELQTQQTRSETLSRCVEHIGHEKSSGVRTAGIIGLETLARDNQNDAEFRQHLCDILQGLINEYVPPHRTLILYTLLQTGKLPSILNTQTLSRAANLTDSEAIALNKLGDHWQANLAGTAQVIHTSARIVAIGPQTLRGPDLSFRYLPGLQIIWHEDDKSSLCGTKMYFSFLAKAVLLNIDLREADLHSSNLGRASLLRTDLTGANLEGTNLQKTKFLTPKLENADFASANLIGAVYYENEDDYKEDEKNDSPKIGKPIKRENEWLKKQGAKNWEKAIYSDDSKE